MIRFNKKRIFWTVIVLAALVLINGGLFYARSNNSFFSSYTFLPLIILVVVIIVIFAKFSLLFLDKIDEKDDEEKILIKRQKEITENMIEGLIVHDLNGKVVVINNAAEQFFGIQSESIKNKTIKEIDNPSQLLKFVLDLKLSEKPIETSFDNSQGQAMFYQIEQVVLSKERGEVLKIIRDVSRAKYLDRMKSEYVTMMSHKILTPLTNIKWAANVLAGDVLSELEKQNNIKTILNNVDGLARFTANLLNVTEVEEGLFGYNFEKVDMGELVENVIKDKKNDLLQHNLDVTLKDIRAGFYFVNGDKNRLAIAVSNYIDNAVRYTPAAGKLEVSIFQDERNLRLNVKDSGIGVSPNFVGSLFTKFFRDRSAKTMHTEGTGAGLFIVKNIIEKHGGKVGYEPVRSGGSMFYLTLPAVHHSVL